MNIQDEIRYSEMLIAEARKLNPVMGYFVKLTSKPLSGDVTVKLTNGTARISGLTLMEFKRSRKHTPKEFIENIAGSFELKESSSIE